MIVYTLVLFDYQIQIYYYDFCQILIVYCLLTV